MVDGGRPERRNSTPRRYTRGPQPHVKAVAISYTITWRADPTGPGEIPHRCPRCYGDTWNLTYNMAGTPIGKPKCAGCGAIQTMWTPRKMGAPVRSAESGGGEVK